MENLIFHKKWTSAFEINWPLVGFLEINWPLVGFLTKGLDLIVGDFIFWSLPILIPGDCQSVLNSSKTIPNPFSYQLLVGPLGHFLKDCHTGP